MNLYKQFLKLRNFKGFEAGTAADLAKQIMILYNNRSLLQDLSTNARNFALSEGNWEFEMHKFIQTFKVICNQH